MSDPTQEIPAEGFEETTEAEASHEGDELARARKEAAARRVKLREVEAERDGLAERLQAMQRAEAERIASTADSGFSGLADGADLFRDGTELGDLLSEDGTVDVERVRERVGVLAEQHPHWERPARPMGSADAGRGFPVRDDPRHPFGDALKGAGG